MPISPLGFVIGQVLARNRGLDADATNRASLLGLVLGTTPVGIIVTNQVIQNEAITVAPSTPIASPTTPAPVGGSRFAAVPDVAGLTEQDARTHLKDFTVTRVNVLQDPSGTVAFQNPAKGTFAIVGSAVQIGVRIGQSTTTNKLIPLPDVVGKSEQEARALLKDFKVERGPDVAEDPSAGGEVALQNPTPAEVKYLPAGSTVKISIRVGDGLIQIPSLIGKTFKEAEAIVKEFNDQNQTNLSIVLDEKVDLKRLPNIRVYFDRYGLGFVVAQEPDENARAAANSVIEVVILERPEDASEYMALAGDRPVSTSRSSKKAVE